MAFKVHLDKDGDAIAIFRNEDDAELFFRALFFSLGVLTAKIAFCEDDDTLGDAKTSLKFNEARNNLGKEARSEEWGKNNG